MIQEIINFIDYLEENSPKVFSQNLVLKEGLYVFLEKEGEELLIKEENVLRVEKKTEANTLYTEFLKYVSSTEMLNAMKSFNSGPKIYIAVGSPFAISITGLGLSKSKLKRIEAAKAYFKAAQKYIDTDDDKVFDWMSQLEEFVEAKMFDYIENLDWYDKVKKTDTFYFFIKEPTLQVYQLIHNKYLSEKLFNKEEFNTKDEDGTIWGISDNLSGFNDKKEFLKHKTASLDLNYRVNGVEALKLYKFFRLQQKNKILPNPMPLFVDKHELTEGAISFYNVNREKKIGHKEIIEHLLTKVKKDLQNYYLIYFHNGLKGSRITDFDFVPVFRYETNDMPEIKALFRNSSGQDGVFHDYSIKNIFHFQEAILNKVFNKQLIVPTKNGVWIKYFDDLEVKVEYGVTEAIVNLFYKYRKAFYDYVYKSRRDAISFNVFDDVMRHSILDDIRHDKEKKYTYRIKEKLNIWFSLYNYFIHTKKLDNMINKTEVLIKRIKKLSVSEEEFIATDEEFAFAAGQLIRTILNKSEVGDRSHSLLEPFLQKTQANKLKLAIARSFETYKHAFKFYKGEKKRYGFDKIMSDVMGFDTDENMKNLLPLILAGYFSESVLKKVEDSSKE